MASPSPVATSGIGRLAIDLPGPAGAENRLLGPDERLAVLGIPDQRAAADAVVREQIERKGVLPGVDVRQFGGPLDDGPHHFLAGGVAQGVDDAVVAVAAFAAQGQAACLLVEVRSPADQFVDPRRRFAHHHLHDGRIAQIAAGASVSAMWSSKRSSGSITPAMPPWAVRRCSIACRLSLVTTRTDSAGSTASAARKPARPPPMISTSTKRCSTHLGSNGTR